MLIPFTPFVEWESGCGFQKLARDRVVDGEISAVESLLTRQCWSGAMAVWWLDRGPEDIERHLQVCIEALQ